MSSQSGFDLNAVMLQVAGASIKEMTLWISLGAVGQGMILTLVLVNTFRYFTHFGHVDPMYVRVAIAIGTILGCGTFAMHCVQLSQFIHHADTDLAQVIRTDTLCNYASMLLGGIYSLSATIFYSVRIWRLSARRWYMVPPLVVLVLSAFSMLIVAMVIGFMFPVITQESLPTLADYFDRQVELLRAYGAVTFASDAVISLAMVYLLLRTKNNIFGDDVDRSLIRRIVVLIYESMLPPTIAVGIQVIVGPVASKGITVSYTIATPLTYLVDWKRIIFACLPLLYYQSLLYSLVARTKVREMLNDRPIANHRFTASGLHRSGQGSQPHYQFSGSTEESGDLKSPGVGKEQVNNPKMGLSEAVELNTLDRQDPLSSSTHDPALASSARAPKHPFTVTVRTDVSSDDPAYRPRHPAPSYNTSEDKDHDPLERAVHPTRSIP